MKIRGKPIEDVERLIEFYDHKKNDALDARDLKALLLKVLHVTALVRKPALPHKLKQGIPYFGRLELARCDGEIKLCQMSAVPDEVDRA
jgi:hypothetical protein